MDDLKAILQKQYIKEYMLRRCLSGLFSFCSLFSCVYGYIYKQERSCILIISIVAVILAIIPPPKGWREQLRGTDKTTLEIALKCLAGLVMFVITVYGYNWFPTPYSGFGFIFIIYAVAISPHIEYMKKQNNILENT